MKTRQEGFSLRIFHGMIQKLKAHGTKVNDSTLMKVRKQNNYSMKEIGTKRSFSCPWRSIPTKSTFHCSVKLKVNREFIYFIMCYASNISVLYFIKISFLLGFFWRSKFTVWTRPHPTHYGSYLPSRLFFCYPVIHLFTFCEEQPASRNWNRVACAFSYTSEYNYYEPIGNWGRQLRAEIVSWVANEVKKNWTKCLCKIKRTLFLPVFQWCWLDVVFDNKDLKKCKFSNLHSNKRLKK